MRVRSAPPPAACGCRSRRCSDHVRRLEAELGVTLVSSTGRGVKLTADGQTFLVHAERVLADADEASNCVGHGTDRGSRVVGIGLTRNAPYYPIDEFVARAVAAIPDLQLRLPGQNSALVAAAVRDGDLDAALVILPVDPEGLEVRPLFSDEVLLVSADPERTRRRARIENLAAAPVILYDATVGLRRSDTPPARRARPGGRRVTDSRGSRSSIPRRPFSSRRRGSGTRSPPEPSLAAPPFLRIFRRSASPSRCSTALRSSLARARFPRSFTRSPTSSRNGLRTWQISSTRTAEHAPINHPGWSRCRVSRHSSLSHRGRRRWIRIRRLRRRCRHPCRYRRQNPERRERCPHCPSNRRVTDLYRCRCRHCRLGLSPPRRQSTRRWIPSRRVRSSRCSPRPDHHVRRAYLNLNSWMPAHRTRRVCRFRPSSRRPGLTLRRSAARDPHQPLRPAPRRDDGVPSHRLMSSVCERSDAPSPGDSRGRPSVMSGR